MTSAGSLSARLSEIPILQTVLTEDSNDVANPDTFEADFLLSFLSPEDGERLRVRREKVLHPFLLPSNAGFSSLVCSDFTFCLTRKEGERKV